jgi:pyruvate dehydrogenase E2 component (dihydrolipoamide acetyltransferase)
VTIEFKLPELGENIEKGDLVRLMIAPGAKIAEGDPVMELETDKAVVEVPSTVSGVVQEVRVKPGDKVGVGQVIFTVDSDGAAAGEAAAPAAPVAAAELRPAATATAAAGETAAAVPEAPRPGGGASVEFKLPELGENIEQGDLVRLMIAPGATVSEGQPVMELETDKAVVEVPSSIGGVVKEVRVKQGDKVKVGQVIFTVEGAAGAATGKTASAGAVAGSGAPEMRPVEHLSEGHAAREAYQSAIRAEGKTEEQALPRDAAPSAANGQIEAPQVTKTTGPEHRPVPASPRTRRLARELGVNIYEMTGTGPEGRITEDDVKAHARAKIEAQSVPAEPPDHMRIPPPPALPDFTRWGKIERVPMRGVRRKTAEHLAQAWITIPHVTQHDKADITELEKLRARFAPKAEQAGGKLTITAIALKVCASALKIFPQFNASVDVNKEEVIYKQYIHIGLATDTERGLLVPVVRDVDKKNIIELAAELAQISLRARGKKLAVEEMEGGTFTITNLGGLGGTYFTPIVNHPEVAILGMSRSAIEPVWKDGKFEPRLMLPLSLSYDHRLIDGADAVRFLRWIVEALEQPFLLSVQG